MAMVPLCMMVYSQVPVLLPAGEARAMHLCILKTYDGDHLGGDAVPCQHLPEKRAVYRVVCLLQVDEAHEQRQVFLPGKLLDPAHNVNHTVC